jgi:hypothetical protein
LAVLFFLLTFLVFACAMVNLLFFYPFGSGLPCWLAPVGLLPVITQCVIADNMMQCVMIVKRFFNYSKIDKPEKDWKDGGSPQATNGVR